MILRLQSMRPAPDREGKYGKLFVGLGCHTPGLIAWAKAGGPQPKLIRGLAEAFGVKREVILALLTGEVDYTVEDDEVVFNWPGSDPFEKEAK